MTAPSRTLAEAVRDCLRSNGLANDHVDTRQDGSPPAVSGQHWVSVFPRAFTHGGSPDQHLGIDRRYSIGIGVTQRTGFAPDDRMYRGALYHQDHGVLSLVECIDRILRQKRYHILDTANEQLTGKYINGKFVEPLRLQSGNLKVVVKGPDWWKADPCKADGEHNCDDFGVYAELTYSQARYMESFIGVLPTSDSNTQLLTLPTVSTSWTANGAYQVTDVDSVDNIAWRVSGTTPAATVDLGGEYAVYVRYKSAAASSVTVGTRVFSLPVNGSYSGAQTIAGIPGYYSAGTGTFGSPVNVVVQGDLVLDQIVFVPTGIVSTAGDFSDDFTDQFA